MRIAQLLLFIFSVSITLALAACGGGMSTLHTVRSGTGSGDIDFQVENKTDVPINNLYMAKTSAVDAANKAKVEPGSEAEANLWGPDQLARRALSVGGRIKVGVSDPGIWDVRAVDRDGRYQHIGRLKLEAGGQYILELGDGGWRAEPH